MASKNELISIVVPVYNVEPYLARCLDSLLAQSYHQIEVIVVDDGSTDGCPALCDAYAQRDSRLHVIHRSNGGLAAARNTGIEVASGEWIGFVDSDDWVQPFMYERLLNAAVSNDCNLAVCGIAYAFDDGKIIEKTGSGSARAMDFQEAITEMNDYRLFDMGAWSKLYRRSLFDSLRFPEGKLSEDFFIMPRLFDLAGQVAYEPSACYFYFQRANSITKSKKINTDFFEAAHEQMDYLDNFHPGLSIVGHCAFASAALTVYDSYLKNGVPCSRSELKCYQTVVKEERRWWGIATHLSHAKTIQFRLFCLSPTLYDFVFRLYRRIRRV